MKAIATNPNNAEPLPIMAVAVGSLSFGLLCLQPVDGYKAGDIRPVLAYNREENSVITNGHVPNDWRMVVETGNFHKEVLFVDHLPPTGEEIVLEENPGQYQLILTDCRVIEMPTPTEPEAPTCKVIKHPASYAPQRIEKPASKKKPNGRQLFLFPETDLQPQKETA